MKWIGHTEFGPNYVPINSKNLIFENDFDINHWVEQWYLTYRNVLKSFKKKKNVYFISYEKLCSNKNYWYQIQNIAEIEKTYDFEFKESKKFISKSIKQELINKSLSLYSDLSDLNLNY